jgi:hypothetical protein
MVVVARTAGSFVILALIYVALLFLVGKVFTKTSTRAAAGSSSTSSTTTTPTTSTVDDDDNDLNLDFDMADNQLPPLGDLQFEPASAPPQMLQNLKRSSKWDAFADNLDRAMSQPAPLRQRAPPRVSQDIMQPIIDIDQDSSSQRQQQPQQRQQRSRRQARRPSKYDEQHSGGQHQHMDEVIRDMNSKSGIERIAAPEVKVVYPNEDATYGADLKPQAAASSSSSSSSTTPIVLSPEERIMMAHRSSLG